MPFVIQIYLRGSGNFRPLEIEMNTSASVVLRMCAERLRLGPAAESFALCEAIQRGNSVAERLVGPAELIGAILQRWQRDGLNQQARFILSFSERAAAALLSRAAVLQGAGQLSSYAAVAPPPDISGLLNALTYYFAKLDPESTNELLLTMPDGSFLVRDGSEPDVITISFVFQYAVFHVNVHFDIRGFFVEVGGQQRFLTVEDVLQYLASMQYPLRSALTQNQAPLRVMLAAQVRTFPCFYSDIGAPKAEEVLRGQRNGTFLIRPSSRDGNFATSYVTDGQVRHSLVAYSDQGLSTPGDNRFYPSLDRFIDASRMMFFGLPRCNASVDDQLLIALGVRESHRNELANGLAMSAQNWQ